MSGPDLTQIIPKITNQNFCGKVIRHMGKDEGARVESFEVAPALLKPGENFASAIIFIAKVIYDSKFWESEITISLIIKSKPILGPELAIIAVMHGKSPFEMAMYVWILS